MNGYTNSSGILTLRQTAIHGEIHSTYHPVTDYPIPSYGGFGVKCKNRVICGGVIVNRSSGRPSKDVYE